MYPVFFSIILETDEDISVAIEKNESTFMHEFIHYLQDINLPYNIRVNLSNIRWFLNIQHFAVNNGYIKRPFKEWDDDANLTKLQYSYTVGPECFVDDVKNIGQPNNANQELKKGVEKQRKRAENVSMRQTNLIRLYCTVCDNRSTIEAVMQR